MHLAVWIIMKTNTVYDYIRRILHFSRLTLGQSSCSLLTMSAPSASSPASPPRLSEPVLLVWPVVSLWWWRPRR